MAHEQFIYLFQMVIFYSYVSLPKGSPYENSEFSTHLAGFFWLRLYLITLAFDAGYSPCKSGLYLRIKQCHGEGQLICL